MNTKNFFRKQLGLWQWLVLLLGVSIVISIFYSRWSDQNEHRNRLQFAEDLLKHDDTEALQRFEQWQEKIRVDSLILCEKTDETSKLERLKQILDSTFFENYTAFFIFCDAGEEMFLPDDKTLVDCHAFFEQRMEQQGRLTATENLFEIRPTPFDFSYLGTIEISESQNLYIEFACKRKMSWLQNVLREGRYSVAYYDRSDRSELVKHFGNFAYPLKLATPQNRQNKTFTEYENFDHLLVFIEDSSDEKVLVVSKRIPRFQNRFSAFSFVFLLNLCFGLLILFVSKRAFRLLFKSFAQRLQLTILGIVLATFIMIGITSVLYVQELNSQKNQKVLREKTYSLLLLMEQTFGDYEPIEILTNPTLRGKLTDFSNVFFTDIFFYDALGELVEKSSIEAAFQNSSRNEMNPEAFRQVNQEHKNFYIQKETLNNHTYFSSYMPFRNYQNELVGYLNLPHFAKQTELRQEISAFVRAYINLFVVLILFAFIVVFFIIKRLTKPLIESERQIAWNEMAKQIAHEIKNPLTPMKLNVQHIQKAWSDKKEDFGDRMKHFSTVMVEQIDTLSAIASEFATFAQQPHVELVEVNAKYCLEKVVLLMNADDIIRFETTGEVDNTTILADEKQLSRALVNIVKNAKQAVAKMENPQVSVSLKASENTVVMAIHNNGEAIPAEIHNRIFEPSFTTKTSGMGLGLAIAKNIIERFNGTISFETGLSGTVFYVELPKLSSNE